MYTPLCHFKFYWALWRAPLKFFELWCRVGGFRDCLIPSNPATRLKNLNRGFDVYAEDSSTPRWP